MSSQALAEGVMKPTTGAVLLGSVLSAMFFGLTMMQNQRYYEICWGDSMRLKLFVALIGALNTAQMVTVTHCDWWDFVHNYQLPTPSNATAWSLALGVGITTSIALMVHSFFALRIWIICRNNRVIALSLAMLAMLQLGKTTFFLQYLRAACEELSRTARV